MLIDSLLLKEKTAIELKYVGNPIAEIATKIDTPEGTVKGWFESRGKLFDAYQEYVHYMNEKRQKDIEDKIAVSDDEFFTISTNIVRMVGKRMQPRRVLIVDKEGNAIAGPDGQPQYVMQEPNVNDFDVNDFKTAWQMQRIMKGLPINYEKQEVEQTNFESDVIIKELGLTDEDFSDERIEDTTKRIMEHLNRIA